MFAKRFMEGFEGRPSTRLRYRELLDLHILPAIGAKPLPRIERADVHAMMRGMVRKGLRAATANRARELTRHILNEAMKDELVARNVAQLCDPFKTTDSRRPRPLEAEHIARYLQLCAEAHEGPLWLFLTGMGWRMGEVLGLCWEDVDLDASTATLERELRREKIDGAWRYVLQPPKTAEKAPDSAMRTVAMPLIVNAALERQKAQQAKEQLEGGSRWRARHRQLFDELHPVFLLRDGSVVNNTSATHRLKGALRDAGLPETSAKDLGRHTMSALAAARGVDPRLVAAALGHTRPSTTLDTYSRRTIGLTAMVAAALDEAFTASKNASES